MALSLEAPLTVPKELSFSPYSDNGGSIVAVAGENYAVIASDTRLSVDFSIYSREQPKLFKVSNSTVLGCTGCWCDALSIIRLLEARMQMYLHEHQKVMSTSAVAQMLSTMLYYKRFFPYYVSNILAGLDSEGKGVIYNYDPIGSMESCTFRAGGSSSFLLQPLLDNQIGGDTIDDEHKNRNISLEKAISIIKDAFISATERDIYTGDSIIFNIITADGVREERFQLRKD